MKKFNEFSISAFVATVPEVKEFEKSSVARFCLSVSHVENKGDEKVSKTALLPVEKWVSNDKKDELNDLKGKYVGCHGFFKPDTWEEDGKKRWENLPSAPIRITSSLPGNWVACSIILSRPFLVVPLKRYVNM